MIALRFLLALIVMAAGKTSDSWDLELKLAKLESTIDHLQKQVSDLQLGQVKQGAELKVATNMASSALDQSNSTWSLTRTQILFPSLEKIALHQTTETYTETLPTPLPVNTRALIVSVFCNFWNGANSHAYLNVDVQQEGSDEGGLARLENTHFNVYANTFYYEVMIPWDTALSDKIVFAVKSSYQTGGDKNWYRLRVVGYVTA